MIKKVGADKFRQEQFKEFRKEFRKLDVNRNISSEKWHNSLQKLCKIIGNKKILNINSDPIVPSQQWKRYKKNKNKLDITSLDLIYDY